ncbi:hypothetical protein TSOC_001157 [Tetrabaena socialis]|uniref:Uncharacterized protein n=1 Tax=Tetrabaena socialis TaxID=47790 RepID=A0A2J8AHF3_9CHLO|nr:hypothetical protein TSOC_001157 [Tetrabaena socialis]|eukprot:PNH11945.1 hypothetical protein TSOC_001157 [Tetrabaena socialis]
MARVSLLDVLRCLSSQAADSLVDCRREKSCLSAARLSCRALRSCVDGSATRLTITVRAADRHRWEAGQLPPSLMRWPRCRHVAVTVDSPAGGGDEAALLALLPFAGQQAAARQRIETLTLRAPRNLSADNGESLVCLLVQRLPGLRSLDFGLPGCWSYEPFQQQLMYDALAGLPCLESLTLPGRHSLDHVGALAASNSLRSLRIVERWGDGALLSAAAVAGLQQLLQLEELVLPRCQLGADGSGGEAQSGLYALFRSGLPPSLQQLTLWIDGVDINMDSFSVEVWLDTGRFSRVCTQNVCLLVDLEHMAQLLLSCPAMDRTLEQLSIFGVQLGITAVVAQREHGQLRNLLQRCARAPVEMVWIAGGASAADLAVLPLLMPDDVTLVFNDYTEVHLSFRQPESRAELTGACHEDVDAGRRAAGSLANAATPTSNSSGERAIGQRSVSPAPADLLRAALRRMVAAEHPSSSDTQVDGSSTNDAAAGDNCSSGGAGDHIVLLQGPFVASLLLSEPGALDGWVRHLAAQAAAAPVGDNDSGEERYWDGQPVVGYLTVPPAASLLVACKSSRAAAAVAAAAARTAAGAAVPVGTQEVGYLGRANAKYDGAGCADALRFELKQVMTAFWDVGAHGGEGFSQRERLGCLLALLKEYAQLPAEKRL